MAKATTTVSRSNYCFHFSFPLLSLMLFTNLPHPLNAQSQPGQMSNNDAMNAALPTLPAIFSDFLAEASPSALPTDLPPIPTDSANYASQSPSTQDRGVLNYYFLLLAIIIIGLAIIYFCLSRRRQKRLMALRNNRRSALAQDMRTWPIGGRIVGRWRGGAGRQRAEEGLDERGEAPPPYLKEPERVHHQRGDEGMELHDLGRSEGKPPDYC